MATVKIDRSFVSGLPDSREDLAMVSAVISSADFHRPLDAQAVRELWRH